MHLLTGLVAIMTLTALLIARGDFRVAGFVVLGSIFIALISRVFFVSIYLRGTTAERRARETLFEEATRTAAIATNVLLGAIAMAVILANGHIGVLETVKFVALFLLVTFLVSTARKSGMRRKSPGT